MKNNDLLTSMNLENYIKEIMKIPLAENCPKYNKSHNRKTFNKKAAAITRKLSRYPSLKYKQNQLKLQWAELTQQVLRAEKTGEIPPCHYLRKRELTDTALELGKVCCEIRKLEDFRKSINNPIVKAAVEHRYFRQELPARLPSWEQTASEIGVPLSGDELRGYVCKEILAMNNITDSPFDSKD